MKRRDYENICISSGVKNLSLKQKAFMLNSTCAAGSGPRRPADEDSAQHRPAPRDGKVAPHKLQQNVQVLLRHLPHEIVYSSPVWSPASICHVPYVHILKIPNQKSSVLTDWKHSEYKQKTRTKGLGTTDTKIPHTCLLPMVKYLHDWKAVLQGGGDGDRPGFKSSPYAPCYSETLTKRTGTGLPVAPVPASASLQ